LARPPGPPLQRLFEGRHLRASLIDPGADCLIVTFDFRRTLRDGFSAATHSTGFARQGFGQLMIQTAANDWFINPDTAALEAALAGLAGRFGQVRLLGYSMGGYGALRFARALNADTAVIISPQVSIAPRVVPFDRRYRNEGLDFDATLGDLQARAMPGLQGLILADPFVAADRRHVAMIQALFPGLAFVRLGFGGHPAIRVLRGAKAAWWVQRAAASAIPAPAPVLAAHRAARAGSAGYWQRLARHAQARHPALAAHALTRAAALAPLPGDAEDEDGDGLALDLAPESP